jgi:hypothetical protein
MFYHKNKIIVDNAAVVKIRQTKKGRPKLQLASIVKITHLSLKN